MKSIVIAMLFSVILSAQVKKIITTDGEIFELREIGGIVIKEGSEIRFDMVMPAEVRIKTYKEVDVKKGDLLLMMNGKKIDDVKKADDIYKELKPGDEIKLGLKRGEQMFIVSFKKAKPEDLPRGSRVVLRDTDMPKGTVFLPDDGLMLGIEGDKIVIREKLPMADNDLKEGDQLKELNGKEIKTAKDFTISFEKMKPGEKLLMKFKSGKVLTTKKPESKNKVVIKTEKK